jgi:hypothetical protein
LGRHKAVRKLAASTSPSDPNPTQSRERLTQSANRNAVEKQQRGTTTNSKGKDAMKEKQRKRTKTLDASDVLIESRLQGHLAEQLPISLADRGRGLRAASASNHGPVSSLLYGLLAVQIPRSRPYHLLLNIRP